MKKTLSILVPVMMALTAVFSPACHARTVESYPMAHDPVVAFCDGRYYLFTTGFRVGMMVSDDMKNWESLGSAFRDVPAWTRERVPGFRGHMWAPDILFHDGLWYLYYSCSAFGRNTSAIGVATNRTLDPESPDYKWVDRGEVIASIPGRDDWNAIDPNVVIDEEGRGWLSFGSFWSGIKLVRLDGSLTRIAEPQEWYGLCHRPEDTLPLYDEPDTAVKPDPRGVCSNPATARWRPLSSSGRETTGISLCRMTFAAAARKAPTRLSWAARTRLQGLMWTGTGPALWTAEARSSCRAITGMPVRATAPPSVSAAGTISSSMATT